MYYKSFEDLADGMGGRLRLIGTRTRKICVSMLKYTSSCIAVAILFVHCILIVITISTYTLH